MATSQQVCAEAVTIRQQMAGLTCEAEDLAWKGLFKIGGIAALIAGLIFRRNLGAELTLLKGIGLINAGPAAPPTTVLGWFTLLRDNPLLGLTWLNLFDMVNYALVGLMFLALFITLRRASPSALVMAAALGFGGVVIYLASNQALTMLSLSHQYAVATTDLQRSLLMAAGQATLAIHDNAGYEGAGLYLSFFGVTMAGLIIAVVMRRSKRFGKAAAYSGILANGLGLSYYLVLVFAPALVAVPIAISALFLLAWYLLIGRKLLQLGQGGLQEERQITAEIVKEKKQ